MTNPEIRDNIYNKLKTDKRADTYVIPYRVMDVIVEEVSALITKETNKAEELMGEAVIARMIQANYQWEKVESFIQSYQLQKAGDLHGIFKKLQQLNKEGE